MKSFVFETGTQGCLNSQAIPIASTITNMVLAQSTAETVTVPAGAKIAVFSANADFWINAAATAAVPSGDVTDGSGAILNPTIRGVGDIASFSIVTGESGGALVSIEWFS